MSIFSTEGRWGKCIGRVSKYSTSIVLVLVFCIAYMYATYLFRKPYKKYSNSPTELTTLGEKVGIPTSQVDTAIKQPDIQQIHLCDNKYTINRTMLESLTSEELTALVSAITLMLEVSSNAKAGLSADVCDTLVKTAIPRWYLEWSKRG